MMNMKEEQFRSPQLKEQTQQVKSSLFKLMQQMNKKDKHKKKISLDLGLGGMGSRVHASDANQLTITFKKPHFVV